MIDPSHFRRVMGHFAAGVSIVTTLRDDGTPAGLTVSAVCSVSLEPTLVLACVDRASESHGALARSGVFAINMLEEGEGETLARRFGTSRGEDKFTGVAFHAESTGAPVLDAALAWLDCRVRDAHEAGDHTIFVGEVEAADTREATPLVYYRGGYGRFAS